MNLDILSSENMDAVDNTLIKEELIVKEEIEEDDTSIMRSLELTPVIYTTRLDDMTVLKGKSFCLSPREVTAKILQESKPQLCNYPSEDNRRSCKKSFRLVKQKLHKIYKNNNSLEEVDIKPDISTLQIDPNLVKYGASDETNTTCKYSELLKLCRPLSVVVSKVIDLGGPKSRVVHCDQVLKTKAIKNVPFKVDSSSDEDEPLITLDIAPSSKPRNNEPEVNVNGVQCNDKVTLHSKINSTLPTLVSKHPKECAQTALFLQYAGKRIITNGMMEIRDMYSKEFNIFCTDCEGHVIDYYKDKDDNAHKYEYVYNQVETRLTFINCCWVQREQYIQNLYPRFLLHKNVRFIKKPHMCPLGACICCCRNKEEFVKPDIIFTDNVSSVYPPPSHKEDIEIQAIEDEIQSSIMQINNAPRLNTTDWLRSLLRKPSTKAQVHGPVSLIAKALTYKKPLPKKQTVNRRLLTVKQDTTQLSCIILRNFASDEREIYELNSNGELQSYIKLTCFNNKRQPGVSKLLQKSKSVHDVCCWFKREKVITQLIQSRALHSSVVKFIRSRHTCTSDKCSCCCKPNNNSKNLTLTDIKLPLRPDYWPTVLNNIELVPKQPKMIVTTDSGIQHIRPFPTSSSSSRRSNIKRANDVSRTFKTNNSNNDCEIVAVHPAPKSLKPNPLPTDHVRNIANVLNGDEMSEEVNTLITSILERFKDVRLTINSDGKVAASLNTPINSLTTVELKVLASILSYAQSQINLLGLNSGMSLSSIINMKMNANTQPGTSNYTDSMNKNIANNESNRSYTVTDATNFVGIPETFPKLNQSPTKENVYEYFTNSLSVRNEGFNDSFSSFLSTRFDANGSMDTVTPVIQNVFSLKEEENTENDTSSTTVWYRQPTNTKTSITSPDITSQQQENGKKRVQVNTETETTPTKRLRVVSPTKLGASSRDVPNQTLNMLYMPPPVLKSQTVEVGGLNTGLPLLANKNFRLVSVVNPEAQPGGTQTRSIGNPCIPTVSSHNRTLVVAPLRMTVVNDDIVKKAIPLKVVPDSVVSMASVATSTEVSPPTCDSVDDDDDCILGM